MDGLQELWVKKMDIYLPTHEISEALAVKYDVGAANIPSILLSLWKMGNVVPTKILLISWQNFRPWVDMVTLEKSYMFGKML